MARARATVSAARLIMTGDVSSEPRQANVERIFEHIY
jgi:hypothetical protein